MSKIVRVGHLALYSLVFLAIGACGLGNLSVEPTCSDGIRNGDEADVDCGRACAPNLCRVGQACRSNMDCESGTCHLNECREESKAIDTPASQASPQIDVPQIDFRKAWYGVYEGFHFGYRSWSMRPDSSNRKTTEWEEGEAVLEISRGPIGIDDIERAWYLSIGTNPTVARVWPHLWLPLDLSDAPGLSITNTKLVINPSSEYPYEVSIEKEFGQRGEVTLRGKIEVVKECREIHPLCWGQDIGYFSAVGVPEVLIPLGVSQSRMYEVGGIYAQVASGEMNEGEAQKELDEIAREIGKSALAWIVGRMPVYSAEGGRWQSFDEYARDFAGDSGLDPDSRLAQDPVGVGVDLMFGDPSVDDILDWMGFGD